MDENTRKFEIKIDPLDFHVGLKDNMAEFESLIRMNNPGKNLAEKIEKDLHGAERQARSDSHRARGGSRYNPRPACRMDAGGAGMDAPQESEEVSKTLNGGEIDGENRLSLRH